MASPDTDHGFTRLANELLDVLAQTPLSGYEIRYLFALWRKTYGYSKKSDRISNSQFVQATGLHKGHITRTQARLIQRKIVTKNGNELGFNKNYDEWLDRDGVTKIGYSVTKNGNKKLPKMVDTKEKKETIQKKVPASRAKPMKKNRIGSYSEHKHSDDYEETIDADTGTRVDTTPKDGRGQAMKALIQAAEKQRGRPFMNYGKQRKAIAAMFDNGLSAKQIGARWVEMSIDPYWKNKGFDFMDVLNSFDKKGV